MTQNTLPLVTLLHFATTPCSTAMMTSKPGVILTTVLLLFVTALVVEILYILYRRRQFHLQNLPSTANATDTPISRSSKELLYLLCCKNGLIKSRIEPSASPPILPTSAPVNYYASDSPMVETQLELSELMKLRGGMGLTYGPSRALFTIKEEEREDILESGSPERKVIRPTEKGLSDRFEDFEVIATSPDSDDSAEGGLMGGGAESCFETPVSSPSDSPHYYTPTPSPGLGEI